MDTNRCLLVPAAQRTFAQNLAKAAGGVSLDKMWLAGCSTDGNTPASWFVIEGMIPAQIAAYFPLWLASQNTVTQVWTMTQTSAGNAAAVTAAAVTGGMTVTLAQTQALFAAIDVTQQNVWTALGRLGLKRIAGAA